MQSDPRLCENLRCPFGFREAGSLWIAMDRHGSLGLPRPRLPMLPGIQPAPTGGTVKSKRLIQAEHRHVVPDDQTRYNEKNRTPHCETADFGKQNVLSLADLSY